MSTIVITTTVSSSGGTWSYRICIGEFQSELAGGRGMLIAMPSVGVMSPCQSPDGFTAEPFQVLRQEEYVEIQV